jgi:hypothetical protein
LGFSRERKRSTGGEGTRMMDVLSLLFLGRTIGATATIALHTFLGLSNETRHVVP